MTAITTAGLLAGLFGSAFVPSALAVRSSGSLDKPLASATNVVSENTTYYDTYSEDVDPDRGEEYDVSYLYDVSTSSAHRFTFPSFAVQEAYSDRDYEDGTNDLSIGFQLMTKGTGSADKDQVTVADLSAVSSDNSIEIAWAYTEDEATTAASCSNSDIVDLFSYNDSVKGVAGVDGLMDAYSVANENGRTYILCFRPVDNTKPGTSTVTVTANGVKVATVSIRSLGDLDSLTLSNTYGYSNIAESNNAVPRFFKYVGKDSAGQVINDASNSMSPFDLYEWTGGNDIEQRGYDDDEEVTNEQGDVIDFLGYFNDDNAVTATGADAYSENRISLQEEVCVPETNVGADDGSAGNTYNLGIEQFNADGDLIQSNTTPITCTGSIEEYTLKTVTLEYTTGDAVWADSTVAEDDADGRIGIYATFVDAAGRPMGMNGRETSGGGNDHTIGITISSDALVDMNMNEATTWSINDGNHFLHITGSKTLIGSVIPNMVTGVAKRAIALTIEDWDANYSGTATLADLEKTLYYTATSEEALDYSISRTRNAAKTQATFTADYGLACSNARIGFEWESNDGSKYGIVTRKANIDGVAKFVMNRRNTKIWVLATGCANLDEDSDTIGARFK